MRKLDFLKAFLFYSLLFMIAFSSCSKQVEKETEVYFNDFEQADLTGIENGVLLEYNQSTVLGNYNNSGFTLRVTDLPTHDLIKVSFDLLIHDSWDGNKLGIGDVDGPDIWELIIEDQVYIHTTFLNMDCINANGMFCPPQSYPADYPNNNNYPRKGASKINLPGVCHPEGMTTLYKITKTVAHSKDEVKIQGLDQLLQLNAEDPKCDESWSVDNIRISTITFK